ncbi:hypothetical protein Hdeb2414_s0005g00184441 [Helianthus debilis subsp. tardiflorus]
MWFRLSCKFYFKSRYFELCDFHFTTIFKKYDFNYGVESEAHGKMGWVFVCVFLFYLFFML